MIVYKVFLKPLTHYVVSPMANLKINLFCKKLEPVEYKVTLAITSAMQGTFRDKIYKELGLESIKSRR